MPRNSTEARMLDERTYFWQDAEKAELESLYSYNTFIDLGQGAKVLSWIFRELMFILSTLLNMI